ncbi:hypothetical protein MUK42_22148 [Musa troglodytarum]|uniref:Uncharacterized protein n=1 Tax=Musa troglodytarum TaxID=320322 RepID=A0A9E7JXR1_9LILI|nr:hypothetical protein MUK42_22148 [Musa troglodytarum]
MVSEVAIDDEGNLAQVGLLLPLLTLVVILVFFLIVAKGGSDEGARDELALGWILTGSAGDGLRSASRGISSSWGLRSASRCILACSAITPFHLSRWKGDIFINNFYTIDSCQQLLPVNCQVSITLSSPPCPPLSLPFLHLFLLFSFSSSSPPPSLPPLLLILLSFSFSFYSSSPYVNRSANMAKHNKVSFNTKQDASTNRTDMVKGLKAETETTSSSLMQIADMHIMGNIITIVA